MEISITEQINHRGLAWLLVIVAVAGGIISIANGIIGGAKDGYALIFPHMPDIRAELSVDEQVLPKGHLSRLQSISTKRSVPILQSALTPDSFRRLVPDTGAEAALEAAYYEHLDSIGNEFRKLRYLDSRIIIGLTNSGTREAKSINIDFGHLMSGICSLDSIEATPVDFERVATIAEIRPGSEAKLYCWVNGVPNVDTIRINHPEGVIKIADKRNPSSTQSVLFQLFGFLCLTTGAAIALFLVTSGRGNFQHDNIRGSATISSPTVADTERTVAKKPNTRAKRGSKRPRQSG